MLDVLNTKDSEEKIKDHKVFSAAEEGYYYIISTLVFEWRSKLMTFNPSNINIGDFLKLKKEVLVDVVTYERVHVPYGIVFHKTQDWLGLLVVEVLKNSFKSPYDYVLASAPSLGFTDDSKFYMHKVGRVIIPYSGVFGAHGYLAGTDYTNIMSLFDGIGFLAGLDVPRGNL
jgi:hypothetical protein